MTRFEREKLEKNLRGIAEMTSLPGVLVVVDSKKGIYEKLKDKTRSEAINDVKKVFKEWASQYQPENSELAEKLIFNNI